MEINKYIFNQRLKFVLIVFIIFFLLIIVRIFWLQIYKNEYYSEKSQANSVRIEPLKPLRGLIFDRNGIVLAENVLTYDLTIDITNKGKSELNNIIEELSRIITITSEDKKFFYKAQSERKFLTTIPIKKNISKDELAKFVSQKYLYPDIKLEEEFIRHYPFSKITAHLVGYINRISKDDQNKFNKNKIVKDSYFGLSHTGKQGLEKFFESDLKGTSGFEKIRVDARNNFVENIDLIKPKNGKDVYLSIDVNLQKKSHEILKGHKGAIVLSEIKSNEILSYQSNPTFDPNLFVNGINHKEWNKLNQDQNKPMLDRVVSASYPPGSTIKPFVAIAGLENKIIDQNTTIFDNGFYNLPKTKKIFNDWKKEGHGEVDLIKALAESCDVFFYELAYKLGIDKLNSSLSKFYFGKKTEIQSNYEKEGILPSPEWKKKSYRGGWNAYETINSSIGQGDFLTTPIQLIQALNMLLLNRNIMPPSVIKETNIYDDSLPNKLIDSKSLTEQEYIEIIKKGMEEVTNHQGTFQAIANSNNNKLAGKTGTAQVFSLNDQVYDDKILPENLKDHALFIGYAPHDNPKISIAVIVENGGNGSSTAAPIAKKLVDHYFKISNE